MQLPVGARFEFEGVTYVKSSALLATPEADGPGRMIPRWAQISGPDTGAAAVGSATDEIDADRLRRARARFWASLDRLPPAGG